MSNPQETSHPDGVGSSAYRCDPERECTPDSGAEPWKEEPGAMLGPYRLLQRIGEGGFGVVYMAEQREPVRRKVALKLIKPGMDTHQVIARFEAERQALAMMDHPNIARVLDAGTTRQARPFFVMELVKGVPITTYCDTENLTTRERLQLFCQVCRAVQHAHQKGIIHRDLKPSNVLVTLHDGKPVPKVIDFGIAKATNVELTARTLFTEYRQFIGTPEYMSPEQAEMSGLDIDTRSDIYSLGVLLYELLTGTTPFQGDRLRSAALDEIQRIIREEEPPRPSTRVSSLLEEPSRFSRTAPRKPSAGKPDSSLADTIARHRRTDPQHLKRELRGDLDWIIMRTLEKDRTRRYDTASALADDIERHLSEQPVAAGPPSAGYRMRKFYRRNRGRVVAATALAAVFVLGLIGTSAGMVVALRSERAANIERQKAVAAQEATDLAMKETDAAMREAKQQAEIAEAVNSFLNENLLASVAPDEAGRDVTVLQVLDRAAQEIDDQFTDQPAVQATLHHTIGKSYTALGRYPEAERHLERSLQIRRRLFGDDRRETIVSHASLAGLYLHQVRYADAQVALAGLLERARRHLGADDETTLGIGNNLAVAHIGQGEYGEAERLLRETLSIIEARHGKDHPIAIKTLGTLGNIEDDAGRADVAEDIFEEVLERQQRALGKDHIDTLTTRQNLGMLYRSRGQLREAEQMLEEVLAIRRDRLGNDHSETFASLTNLALVYRSQGRHAEALPLLMEAVDTGRRVLGVDNPYVQIAVGSLAEVYEQLGKPQEAELLLIQALDVLERAQGMSHPNTLAARADLMSFYRRAGNSSDVERLAADHVRALKRAAERPDATHDTLNTAAYELVTVEPASLRDPTAAVAFAQRACEMTEYKVAYYLDTLACALSAAGDPAQAVEIQTRALAMTPEADPGRPEMLAHLEQFQASLTSKGGEVATSQPVLEEP